MSAGIFSLFSQHFQIKVDLTLVVLCILMGESNTVVSADIMYRGLTNNSFALTHRYAFNIDLFVWYQVPLSQGILVILPWSVHLSMISEFFLSALGTKFFRSHWLLSFITIVEIMDYGDRGLHSIGTTVITHRKGIARIGDRTSDLLVSSPILHQLSHRGSVFSL